DRIRTKPPPARSELERLQLARWRRIDDRLVAEVPGDNSIAPVERVLVRIDLVAISERGLEPVAANHVLDLRPPVLGIFRLPQIEQRIAEDAQVRIAIEDMVAAILEDRR